MNLAVWGQKDGMGVADNKLFDGKASKLLDVHWLWDCRLFITQAELALGVFAADPDPGFFFDDFVVLHFQLLNVDFGFFWSYAGCATSNLALIDL